MIEHPERRRLERFMRGELPGESSKDIVIHLLSGCDACRRIARECFPVHTGKGDSPDRMPENWKESSPGSYSQVLDRVMPAVQAAEAGIEDERLAAPVLLDELQCHPHERRLLLVRNSRRFMNWSLCELVAESAYSYGARDVDEAKSLAQLAVELSELIPVEASQEGFENDIRSRARSVLGNALRITGELLEASEEFAKAERLLAAGTGDRLEWARFSELKSHLLFEHRKFDDSLALLDSAIRTYRKLNDSHRLGRALISQGYQLSEKGDLSQAIVSLRQGVRLIDGARSPRLVLVAKHNLVHHLYDIGRYHQAMALVPETLALHHEIGNELDLVRFQWLVGQILRDSGDLDRADEELTKVKAYFVTKQIAHDSALVSIDLAAIYLRQHRTAELKELATEMLTIFRALRINREAIAALVLFQKAVELENVSLGLMRDLAAYLKASRHDPRLPFRPSRNS